MQPGQYSVTKKAMEDLTQRDLIFFVPIGDHVILLRWRATGALGLRMLGKGDILTMM